MSGFEKNQTLDKVASRLFLKRPQIDKETAGETVAKIDRKIKRTGDRYAEEELTKDE